MVNEAAGLAAYQQSQQAGLHGQEQRLLIRFADVVKRVVNHMSVQAGVVMSLDDMEQIGLIALLETLRRYPGEPDEVVRRLAAPRIRGAILDELRRLDWRSRRSRQKSHELKDAERTLGKQLGRVPTEPELAEAMGIGLDEIRQRQLDYEAAQPRSFESARKTEKLSRILLSSVTT